MKINFLKKISLNIVLFSLLTSFDVHCGLNNIKGTYSTLSPDYRHLSLVHGAIAWEMGVIRRLYDFGDIFLEVGPEMKMNKITNKPEPQGRLVIKGYTNLESTHKTVRLIHALFYRVPGSTSESDFGETKLLKRDDPIEIAKKVAQILGLIDEIKRQERTVTQVLADLRIKNNEQLTMLNEQLKLLDEKLKSLQKKELGIEMRTMSADDKKLLNQRSELKKQLKFIGKFERDPVLKSNYESVIKGPIREGVEQITNLYKHLLALQKLFEELLAQNPINLAKPSIAQIVLDSLHECDPTNPKALYPANTTEMILLAFVYKACSEDRSVLKIFYDELNKRLGNNLLTSELSDAWVNDSFAPIDQQSALKSLQGIFSQDDQNILNRLDEIVYFTQQIRSMPAPVGYTLTTYEYEIGKRTRAFPDCMCNTIRNLINVLAYDAKNNKFDLAILKKRLGRENDTFDQKLEDYYKIFSVVNDASSKAAHEAWVKVISNIFYVAYLKESSNEDPINATGPGYIAIPEEHMGDQALRVFLANKKYQVLAGDQYGYELMPSARNIIIVVNHLLSLNLFNNGLVQEFSKQDFIKTYLDKMGRALQAKESYQSLREHADSSDDRTNFDDVDFTQQKVFSTFVFDSFSFELMTQLRKHGELYLRGSSNQEEASVRDLFLSKKVSNLSSVSLDLVLINVLSRNDIDLSRLGDCLQANCYLNLFAIPLENTGFLSAIVHRLNSTLTLKTPLKMKLGARDLLLRLAEKQPNDQQKQQLKLKASALFMEKLSDEDVKSGAVDVKDIAKAAESGITDKNLFSNKSMLVFFKALINNKHQEVFEEAAKAAEKGIADQDVGVRSLALDLLTALIQNNYQQTFQVATKAATQGIFDQSSGVRSSALNLFKQLFESNNQQAFEEAIKAATKGIVADDSGIQSAALDLFKELFKMGQGFKEATTLAAKKIADQDSDVRAAVLDIFKALVKKDYQQSFKEAERAASKSIVDQVPGIRTSALELFGALFEKSEGTKKEAVKLAASLMGAESYRKRSSGLDLFKLLFETGREFDSATKLAAKIIVDQDEGIRSSGLDLFKALFENNQAFKQAAEVAEQAIENRDTGIRNSALELFKALFEHDQAFDEALKASKRGVLNKTMGIRNTALDLFKILFTKNKKATKDTIQRVLTEQEVHLSNDSKRRLNELLNQ